MHNDKKLPVAIKAFLIVLGLVAIIVIGELIKDAIHDKPKLEVQKFEVGDEIIFTIKPFSRGFRAHSARILEKEKGRKTVLEPYFHPGLAITTYTLLLDDGREIKLELQHIKRRAEKVTALLAGRK